MLTLTVCGNSEETALGRGDEMVVQTKTLAFRPAVIHEVVRERAATVAGNGGLLLGFVVATEAAWLLAIAWTVYALAF